MTHYNGLDDFRYREEEGTSPWSSWRSWPHLNITIDQGSDGLAAQWYLRHMGMNCTVWCDWSHGAWNDVKSMLRERDLWGWWILMMVTYNVPHGPYNDDQRYGQVMEAWEDCKRHFNHNDCVLFQEYAPAMMTDTADSDGSGETPSLESLWASMLADPPLRKKGYKCNLNRFFGGTKVAREDLSKWHQRLFQYEYTALECSMLSSRKFEKIVIKPRDIAVDAGEGEPKATTDSARFQLDEKALRSCCQNSLVIAISMLGERTNNLLVRSILAVSAPVEAWHQVQNSTLRSAGESVPWMVGQLKGGFDGHIVKILQVLTTPSLLEFCRLSLRPPAGRNVADENLILVENDFAENLGACALSLASNRLQRHIWFWRGWPCRMVGVLGDEALAGVTLNAFLKDCDAFTALRDHGGQTLAMQAVAKRSVFHDTNVKQYTEAPRHRLSFHNSELSLDPEA